MAPPEPAPRSKRLKIFLVDGDWKATTFVNRLAGGLAARHDVCIVGYNEDLTSPVPGVRYVGLGPNTNRPRMVYRGAYWAIRHVLETGRFGPFLYFCKELLRGDRMTIQSQNMALAIQSERPDIIHIQWPANLENLEPHLKTPGLGIILSQRGFQITVRPYVDAENLAYLRRFYPLLDGFHSVSAAAARAGDDIFAAADKIDHVVYSGLDLSALPYETIRRDRTQPVELLSVGRDHWVKGYPYALRACRLLKDAGVSFRYTIIGGSQSEELLFLVADLGLGDCVRLLGNVSAREVFRTMRASHLLLCPSIVEGLANVGIEAMAVGLPVVSTESGGMPELITDGETGWLVPPRAPDALADAVRRFLALDDATLEAQCEAARRKVERQHCLGKMLADMEALYVAASARSHAPKPA